MLQALDEPGRRELFTLAERLCKGCADPLFGLGQHGRRNIGLSLRLARQRRNRRGAPLLRPQIEFERPGLRDLRGEAAAGKLKQTQFIDLGVQDDGNHRVASGRLRRRRDGFERRQSMKLFWRQLDDVAGLGLVMPR